MHRMFIAGVIGAWAALTGVPQQPSTPTFRAGVEVVQVSVSVTDKARKPVRGLGAADFSVVLDGVSLPVVALSEVENARPAELEIAGDLNVEPDVATNSAGPDGRLVVLLLDRSITPGVATVTARRIATAAIDALGPNDLASVVYTSSRGGVQPFTANHALLRRALQLSPQGSELPETAGEVARRLGIAALESGDCPCGLCVLNSVREIAESVRGAVQRRKMLLFIGRSIRLDALGEEKRQDKFGCASRIQEARDAMLASVHGVGLTIDSFDPSGLESATFGAQSSIRAGDLAREQASSVARRRERVASLRALAEATGGRTVLDSNTPESKVPDAFRETDAYYVLGVRVPDAVQADSAHHKIDVTVARRGVRVSAPAEYVSPVPADSGEVGMPPRLSLGDVLDLTHGGGGLQVRAAAAPFVQPGGSGTAVVVTIEARDVRTRTKADRPGRLEGAIGVYDEHGNRVSVRQFGLTAVSDRAAGDSVYDTTLELDAKPGRYCLQVSIRRPDSPEVANVQHVIEVPDFARASLSISGLTLSAADVRPAQASGVLASLPFVPSVQRDFDSASNIVAFWRLYRTAGQELPVQLAVRVVDNDSKTVFGQIGTVHATEFRAGGAVDCRLELPIKNARPGQYTLVVEARAGEATVRRVVPFRVL